MSHEIEKPWDQVYSIEGTEWHGLANHEEKINREVMADILFPIVEGEISISLEGERVTLPEKAIVADYRFRSDIEEGQRIRPLSVMGQGYRVITNSEILSAVETSIADHGLDAEIVTAGTLRGGKVFFLSLRQAENEMEVLKNDSWKFLLALVSSHDGKFALTPYVTSVRPVCMNTVRWGLDSTDCKVAIYHTKNAGLQLDCLPEILAAMKSQQQGVIQDLVTLAGLKANQNLAERLIAGYFVKLNSGEKVLSTRTSNAIREITLLFSRGKGNQGQSVYDVLNGFTEYYTHGSGTGRNASEETKAFKANMGSAADHKTSFMAALVNPETRAELAELGGQAELSEP